MIEKELIFNYNNNYRYIYDITLENNSDILKIIDDLENYKQGDWKGVKRRDIIEFKFYDIPDMFKVILSTLIVNNIIPLKLKIKKIEDNDKRIIIKVKANLLNKIANLISKIINLSILVTIQNNDDISTNVIIKYTIRSILPKSILENANEYIELKLKNNFIKKIDNYLKDLKINNNR